MYTRNIIQLCTRLSKLDPNVATTIIFGIILSTKLYVQKKSENQISLLNKM